MAASVYKTLNPKPWTLNPKYACTGTPCLSIVRPRHRVPRVQRTLRPTGHQGLASV